MWRRPWARVWWNCRLWRRFTRSCGCWRRSCGERSEYPRRCVSLCARGRLTRPSRRRGTPCACSTRFEPWAPRRNDQQQRQRKRQRPPWTRPLVQLRLATRPRRCTSWASWLIRTRRRIPPRSLRRAWQQRRQRRGEPSNFFWNVSFTSSRSTWLRWVQRSPDV